ncbi:response regulator transcription factor [Nocardiopsis sp. HNM0947]|uniref:Response regulator transcription factor n=1 Tax=Nocardiopsis coralli TaxID=2772213 RepID=A0ABR9P3J0_9ACTN|nr:response regulator transcription factor [Nocardiopsis coralli]MBE2998419.1 response regulator transcription factor [Nocardiopsis coralli]
MIRVLIVDDEELVRASLSAILGQEQGIEVVGEAGDGGEALRAVIRHRPDVVLMDVRMPTMDGIAATEHLARGPHPPRVVVLTTFDLDEYVHSALRAGAAGYLLKDAEPDTLASAVRTVAEGGAMLAPTVTTRLIGTFTEENPSARTRARERLSVLTERETAVIREVTLGLSNAEIGRELWMSEATVKSHLSRALAKLDVRNRVQAAIIAHDAGLV